MNHSTLQPLESLPRECRPSFETAKQCSPSAASFWTLPPEIRALIYEQLHGGNHVRKVGSSRLATARKKTFKCVVEHLLVSRLWFSESVSIFARAITFEFSSFADMAHVASRLPRYISDRVTSISWHSERRIELERDMVDKLSNQLPSLRDVHVHVNSMLMIQDSSYHRKAITRDTLGKYDFATCHGVDALRSFRGLRNFKFVEPQDVMAMRRYYPVDRLAIWEHNLANFELYILAEASKLG